MPITLNYQPAVNGFSDVDFVECSACCRNRDAAIVSVSS